MPIFFNFGSGGCGSPDPAIPHAKGAEHAKAERYANDWTEDVSPRWRVLYLFHPKKEDAGKGARAEPLSRRALEGDQHSAGRCPPYFRELPLPCVPAPLREIPFRYLRCFLCAHCVLCGSLFFLIKSSARVARVKWVGKFHWIHGKPRNQRFLTQRARRTQRKAVFGVNERRNLARVARLLFYKKQIWNHGWTRIDTDFQQVMTNGGATQKMRRVICGTLF